MTARRPTTRPTTRPLAQRGIASGGAGIAARAPMSSPTSPLTGGLPPFRLPLAALALTFTPQGAYERMILREALTPTLRLWAAYLSGRRRHPTRDEALYPAEEGVRGFLCRDLCRERPGHPVSPAMSAYCWYHILTAEERAILTEFALTGRVVTHRAPGAPPPRDDAEGPTQPTLVALPTLPATPQWPPQRPPERRGR